ncbi:MAG TPA: flagellar biosynthetic protein FliO [Nocardioidaceae bacterium]|nr:flagellar biosynthetic protein FliO [Nocardioidaceae bacterium]
MLGLLLRVVLSLAVVLGILWFVANKAGRRSGGRTRLMRVAGRQALSRTASVAVVEVADRVLVLGVSDAGVRLLTELDPEQLAEPEVASPAPALTELPGSALAGSLLAGSVLSPVTWKQAWAAATGRRAVQVSADE